MLRSHLTVLETSSSLYPSQPVFKIPRLDVEAGQGHEWQHITYSEFQRDVELFAKYWARILKSDNVPQRSVVGIW